ncbi:MAG TPA: bifunctional metallophosphatase/5'-nucleotidase, partial [Saprospiraceae bacterium]|nr:bifunctional metallophosphatase/5'-nucleotidase [Saprospiraceae bacterium]
MPVNRRKFLRNTLIGGLGAGLSPLSVSNGLPSVLHDQSGVADDPAAAGTGTITLLQTTDVHCQIHPHDELFWENDTAVFRQTAGYAHLATLFDKVRRKNPNTFIVDTGDMFQGSELS